MLSLPPLDRRELASTTSSIQQPPPCNKEPGAHPRPLSHEPPSRGGRLTLAASAMVYSARDNHALRRSILNLSNVEITSPEADCRAQTVMGSLESPTLDGSGHGPLPSIRPQLVDLKALSRGRGWEANSAPYDTLAFFRARLWPIYFGPEQHKSFRSDGPTVSRAAASTSGQVRTRCRSGGSWGRRENSERVHKRRYAHGAGAGGRWQIPGRVPWALLRREADSKRAGLEAQHDLGSKFDFSNGRQEAGRHALWEQADADRQRDVPLLLKACRWL